MRKRSSDCYSGKMNIDMGSNIDLSLLRRPLTPFTGFHEAKSAFDKGTAEVRHLLLYECGLIYECNICRNMFRSLANFISHKRVFCCTSSKEYNGSHSMNGVDGLQSARQQSREYTIAKHDAELHQKAAESKEVNSNRQASSEANTSGVVEEERKQETRKERTNEIYLSSKIVENHRDDNAKPTDQKNYKVKEIPASAYVFQCPSCSLTFLKSSAVICHLALAHNIPIRRIRMMRDSLLKPRTELAAKNAEKPKIPKKNRKLKSLLLNESSSSSIEQKNGNENGDIEAKCIFCEMIFERRAVLATHMQTCSLKPEITEHSEQKAVAISNGKRLKLETKPKTIPDKSNATGEDIDCQLIDNKNQNSKESDIQTALHTLLENEDVNRTFANLENQNFGTGLQTVSLDKLDISGGESSNASFVAENQNKKIPEANVSEEDKPKDDTEVSTDIKVSITDKSTIISSNKKRRIRSTNAQYCRCKICGKKFNALSNLRRHISMFHYRSRKFGCALCDYCAFRRYDIINHLNFVHKLDTDSRDFISKDLVRVNDVKYTKDDMNEDIVLCSSDELDSVADISLSETALNISTTEDKSSKDSVDGCKLQKTEKRKRRRHNKSLSALNEDNILAADTNIDVKLTRQKLKRSKSQSFDSTHSTKGSQKRPKRNCTKLANKDFVYDLSGIMKKDASQTDSLNPENETYKLRGSKRRNTLNSHFENIAPIPAFDLIKAKHCGAIKGSARRASLLLVSQGLAASSTLPEIPAERPLMRPRLTSMQRSDSQAGPIIETTELETACLKSLPLCDDSYLEKITNECVGSFKIKPCLAQQHSALDSLLQKVDSSKQLNGITHNASRKNQNEENINFQSFDIRDENNSYTFLSPSLLESGCNNNIELAALPSYLTTPEQDIPKTLSMPVKPQKRLPSLDKLNETIHSFENFYNAHLNN